MSSTEPTRRRKGRRGGGPNGEVRNKLIGFMLSDTEVERAQRALRRRGFTPSAVGVREHLLALVAEDEAANAA
jgi:hypothetical protein